MKPWIRFGCFLTGWNPVILQDCTEASRKKLNRYTSSLIIMMILWSIIGFGFASKYLKTSLFASIAIALVLLIIIIQIERQIILTRGHSGWIILFRVILGVVMAFIGAVIIDQFLFKDDISRQMIERRNEEVARILPNQILTLDKELAKINFEIDSINNQISVLNTEINNNPTINMRTASNEQLPVIQDDGSTIYQTKTITTTTEIPNPRIGDLKYLQNLLSSYRLKQDAYINKKMTAEENLRMELETKTGLLVELNALLYLLKNHTEARFLYISIFVFFFSLECLVLISKHSDKDCDYELAIEHQLKIRQKAFKQLEG